MTAQTNGLHRTDLTLDAEAIRGASDQRVAERALAILRVLLLPIVLAGDRLVAHPTVGTSHFDLVLGVACVYSVLVLIDAWRPRGPRLPVGLVVTCDLLLIGALTYESGGAFSQLHAAFLAVPLAAALLLAPRRTAAVSVATGIVYLLVAFTHPATHGTKRLDVTLAQGLYVVWVGSAAVLLSSLLNRRRQRILDLGDARGRLVAQAVEAEERARKRLSDDLHDHAIQNVLTARQDLADARAGDSTALERAETALRQTLEQLRTAVRELHPYLLDHLDLPSGLETIAEQHATRGGYHVQITIDPAAVGTHDQLVASLVRELLANVAKHARATLANVELTQSEHALVLEVSDNGRGFTTEQHLAAIRAGHIGLASSRERVEAVGGTFEIDSTPGTGTRVRCTLPLVPTIATAARTTTVAVAHP
jgi:two-component system NarL family sensor kinase